jgi:hypothetical protein
MRTFSKIGHVGSNSIEIPYRTNVADFGGKVLIFEKKGGADAF